MAKPQQQTQPEKARFTTYRIVPHRNADGVLVPGKWDTEEVTVSGVVEARRVHEHGVTLPVARERHTVLVQRWANREAPESWK